MHHTRNMLLASGVLAIAASAALADSVYVQDLGTFGNVGRGVSVTLSNGLTFSDGSTHRNVWAGQRTLRIDGLDRHVYSAELTGIKGEGWFETQSAHDALGTVKADAIARLFGSHDSGRLAGREQTAAFQAMLWELVYDYDGTEESIDLGRGNVSFRFVNGGQFDAFRTTATRGGSKKTGVDLFCSDSHNDSFRIVPLPSSAGLAGLGLLGIASIGRRRPTT